MFPVRENFHAAAEDTLDRNVDLNNSIEYTMIIKVI